MLGSTYRGEANAEGKSGGSVEVAKGEVPDVPQLMHLGRKLPYVDPMRVAILGQSRGATIAILAIERSDELKLPSRSCPRSSRLLRSTTAEAFRV